MGQSASACKPCKTQDPIADTVKVDTTQFADPTDGQQAQRPTPAEEEEEAAARRQKEEEEAEKRQQEVQERRLEEERLEKERLQADEEERCRLAEEHARRQAEEEGRRRAEEEALAERRRQEEREQLAEAERVKAEQLRAAAAKERAEAEAAQMAVDDFLKARGFKQIGLPRKAFCGASVYPLHLAVEENDAGLVRSMVCCGADLQQKNSANKSPLEVAEKFNKNGSHDHVVMALRGGA